VVIQVIENSTRYHILLELRPNVYGFLTKMHKIKRLEEIRSVILRWNNSKFNGYTAATLVTGVFSLSSSVSVSLSSLSLIVIVSSESRQILDDNFGLVHWFVPLSENLSLQSKNYVYL